MKTAFRKFEYNRYSSNNYCPCGKSNKDGKFATERGFKGQAVGHCHSCQKDFWNDSETIVKPYEIKKEDIPVYCTPDTQDLIDKFDSELKSDFAKFLVKTFGESTAVEVVETYYLGVLDSACNADPNSDVIFWQLDIERNLRAGKIMRYNDKGKRQNYINWWHSISKANCQLNQYFFGGHLIAIVNKPIAIVEAEKTACFMMVFNPAFLWIACGNAGGLQDIKCESISKYDVTLFPDHNQYDNWKSVADKWGFEISKDCEIWFEQGLISKGDDIADYYLNLTNKVNDEVVKIDPQWNAFVDDNPKLNLTKDNRYE